MIKDKIEEIIKKYYHLSDDYYSEYRYDKNNIEYNIKDELEQFCIKNRLLYKVKKCVDPDKEAYSSDLLILTFIDKNNELQLYTIYII
jgi:hypothetical protein